MKSYLLLALLLLPLHTSPTLAACEGQSYCSWGLPQSSPPSYAIQPVSVTFPNGAGIMWVTFNEYDVDNLWHNTCNPSEWPLHGYGTITYNDGTVNYSGTVKVDASAGEAPTPVCVNNGKTYWVHFWSMKIQSCSSSSHVLSNRLIAVSNCNSPCFDGPNSGCDTAGYWYANWLNFTVSGF